VEQRRGTHQKYSRGVSCLEPPQLITAQHSSHFIAVREMIEKWEEV